MAYWDVILPFLILPVALAMAWLFFHRRQPDQAVRRMIGLVVMVLGAIALLAGGLVLGLATYMGEIPVMEASVGAHPSYGAPSSIGLGPAGLSIWLLLVGLGPAPE